MSFAINHLIGFGARRSVARDATVALTANPVSTANASSYTFSSASIGTAATGRLVVVGVGGVQGGSGFTISSVTIGGNAATALTTLVEGTGGGNCAYACLYGLTVDSGTSADVVVNWSAGLASCGIGVWAVYDLLSTTPEDTGTSTTNGGSVSMDCSAGGVIIGYRHTQRNSTGGSTHSWSNLTERFDQVVDSANSDNNSGASDAFATAQTGMSISCTSSPGNIFPLALVSLR